ncbi:MAG: response regulator [Verrucomicrobia bacterium]|nr:response regulator [Verrucomicrobiota bacterium]MCF7709080.1 response regulator [Verrucomicrobiota bacterium]
MNESKTRPRILVIEDDDFQYEIYEDALTDYDLVRARTGAEALEIIPKALPSLIILDHILESGDLGLEYLPDFKEILPHVPIIVVSGALEVQQQIEALQGPRRAHYCLPKPLDIDQLNSTVEIALKECGPEEIIRQFTAIEHSNRVDAETLLTRSTDRLSRQNQIMRKLRGSTTRPNISALAREFKVARRTIIRDLHDLIRRGQLPGNVYPDENEEEQSDNES